MWSRWPGRRLPASVPAPRCAADRDGRSPQAPAASRGPASEPAAVPSIGGPLAAGLCGQAVRPLVSPPPTPATGPHGPVPFGPPRRRRPCMTPLRLLAPESPSQSPTPAVLFPAGPGPPSPRTSARDPPGVPPSPARSRSAAPAASRRHAVPVGLTACRQIPGRSPPFLPPEGPAASPRGSGADAACRPLGVSRAPCRFPVLRI